MHIYFAAAMSGDDAQASLLCEGVRLGLARRAAAGLPPLAQLVLRGLLTTPPGEAGATVWAGVHSVDLSGPVLHLF